MENVDNKKKFFKFYLSFVSCNVFGWRWLLYGVVNLEWRIEWFLRLLKIEGNFDMMWFDF